MKPRTERLLTPSEVARIFGVHVTTVTRWADKGKLPHLRTAGGHRRFRQSDVRRLIAGLTVTPNAVLTPGQHVTGVTCPGCHTTRTRYIGHGPGGYGQFSCETPGCVVAAFHEDIALAEVIR